MKASQRSPGSAASTRARSGPSANWNTKSRRREKKTSALRLSLLRRSISTSFQTTIQTRRA